MNIKSLIQKGEGEQLDFKNKISGFEKIAKTLVAFANHKGGRLLVGVADDGQIKGVKNEEEDQYMLERAASAYCRPPVAISFAEYSVDDKSVLVAEIPESDVKPHYARSENNSWWVYIRVADESILAGKVVVDVLRRQHDPQGVLINYSDKERELLTYFQTNSRPRLLELCKHLRLSRRKTQRLLADLILAGIVAVKHDGAGEYFIEKTVTEPA